MKTSNFNKRVLVTMAFALLCCFSAKAQNSKEWSIIPNAQIGYLWDGTVWLDDTYHVNAGVDAKVSFNEHWSLLTGIEYNYRWGFNRKNTDGWFSNADRREGLQHFLRVPVCAEFTHKWFYADAGLFVERATNTRYDANKTIDFGIGPIVELGGRIRLSETDHIRIGAQTQLCVSRVTQTTSDTETTRTHYMDGGFFGYLLSVGYEHRF